MAKGLPPANDARRYVTSAKQAFASSYPDRVLALAPSVLAADLANLADPLRKMMRAHCHWAHLDVMDGRFVPNITFGPPVVRALRALSPRLFLDTHLMIEQPLDYLDAFVEAGADLVTIHVEAVENLPKALASVRKAGVRVGLSIRPHTPLRLIEPALDKTDLVLIMTVEPGFGGQPLLPNTLNKVRQLARKRESERLKLLIQVDGGINGKTAGLAVAAGANVLVAGTAIFNGRDIAQNIEQLVNVAMRMGS
ncbi:MAG TPA: ribulose-phosphate 3-epimerase [Sumerlaeia bacterium]|nr:ribulose-phosphate 3-epimerase [Sumerlaeia bacterium]